MLGYTIINTANKNYTITIPSGGLQSYNVNFSVTNYNSVGGTVVLAGYWYHHLVDSVMQLTEKICDHIDDKYRFGFNGKEKDNEWAGIGNHQDYGARHYDTRVGRPISVDPLAKNFPSLSPYQFFSDNPILNIDLDGKERYQYLENIKNANGTITTKRVVALDVYVAVSQKASNVHYRGSDLPTIQKNLETEYNKGFKDAAGNDIEFRFNVKSFDVDKTNAKEFGYNLRRNPDNLITNYPSPTIEKGMVLDKGKTSIYEQGATKQNISVISNKANEPSHTTAHEVGHIFLNYNSSVNPVSAEEHDAAGGVFTYGHEGESDKGKLNTTKPTEGVNQDNVNLILKTVPETTQQTAECK